MLALTSPILIKVPTRNVLVLETIVVSVVTEVIVDTSAAPALYNKDNDCKQ